MMEAASISETSVNFCQTIRRNIPEDNPLQGCLSVFVFLVKKYVKLNLYNSVVTSTFAFRNSHSETQHVYAVLEVGRDEAGRHPVSFRKAPKLFNSHKIIPPPF
jgi:hypothetical protein